MSRLSSQVFGKRTKEYESRHYHVALSTSGCESLVHLVHLEPPDSVWNAELWPTFVQPIFTCSLLFCTDLRIKNNIISCPLGASDLPDVVRHTSRGVQYKPHAKALPLRHHQTEMPPSCTWLRHIIRCCHHFWWVSLMRISSLNLSLYDICPITWHRALLFKAYFLE